MMGETTIGADSVATILTALSFDARWYMDSGGKEDRKCKKKERRRKDIKEKRREEKSSKSKNGVRGGGAGLTSAKNKVSTGKSCKMRGAKDLTKKSATDMASIFGVRCYVYSPSAIVNPKSNPSTPSDGGVDKGTRERKKRSRDKKGDDDGHSSGKRKKKRK